MLVCWGSVKRTLIFPDILNPTTEYFLFVGRCWGQCELALTTKADPLWRGDRPYPGEERVEAVNFLSLGDVGVVLGDALQSQLLHQVDLIGLLKVLGLVREEHRVTVGTEEDLHSLQTRGFPNRTHVPPPPLPPTHTHTTKSGLL